MIFADSSFNFKILKILSNFSDFNTVALKDASIV